MPYTVTVPLERQLAAIKLWSTSAMRMDRPVEYKVVTAQTYNNMVADINGFLGFAVLFCKLNVLRVSLFEYNKPDVFILVSVLAMVEMVHSLRCTSGEGSSGDC